MKARKKNITVFHKYSVWKKITSFVNNCFDCLYNVWGLLSDPTPCVSPVLVGGSNLQIEGQVSVSHIGYRNQVSNTVGVDKIQALIWS